MSANANIGDGNLCCEENCTVKVSTRLPDYSVQATVEVAVLDDFLPAVAPPVLLAKLDVEGYECLALRGGAGLFAAPYRPRFVQTEVWERMRGCDSDAYVRSFAARNYTVHHGFFSARPGVETRVGEIDNLFMRDTLGHKPLVLP